MPIEFPDCIGYRLQYEVNPNPIKSGEVVLVKIKNNFTGKRVNVSIYNMQGVMTYNNQYTENVIEIKTSLPPGIYTIKATANGQQMESEAKKFVVIK